MKYNMYTQRMEICMYTYTYIYIYTHTHVMQQVMLMKKRISPCKHLFEFVPDKFK